MIYNVPGNYSVPSNAEYQPSEGKKTISLEKYKKLVALLEDKQKDLKDIEDKLTVAKQDSDAATTDWTSLTGYLWSYKTELQTTSEKQRKTILKKVIRDTKDKIKGAIARSEAAGQLVIQLNASCEAAANEVECASKKLSNKIPLKKTTEGATGPVGKSTDPTTAPARRAENTLSHTRRKPVHTPTHAQTVPTPPVSKNLTSFEDAIGGEPLIDRDGQVNKKALTDAVIEKGLAGHLQTIARLEQQRHFINAGIQALNKVVNQAATQQIVSDGTPNPAAQAARENLKVLTKRGKTLDTAIASAKRQFLDMYNDNGEFKVATFEIIDLDKLLRDDFVLYAVPSPNLPANETQFFITVALSALAGAVLGGALDNAFSNLTSQDLETRFLAHGATAGIGAAGLLEWYRGNLANVSDSSKAIAVVLCMFAASWALGWW